MVDAGLGPSHNDQRPRFAMADVTEVRPGEINEIRVVSEDVTHEISWQDGDVALLDNIRAMHGE